MTNIIPFHEDKALTPKSLQAAVAAVNEEMKLSASTGFLKLSKVGVWVYGQENVEVEEGSLWALSPNSLQHGWISWGDSTVLGEHMVSITKARKAEEDLEPTAAEWKEQWGVQMCCIEGADEGINVIYNTTSKGGHTAFDKYYAALKTQFNKDGVKVIAVCELKVSSYHHKEHSRIFIPILDIRHWVDTDGSK